MYPHSYECEVAIPLAFKFIDSQGNPPTNGPMGLTFEDISCDTNTISGIFTIHPPTFDSDIDEYRIFFATNTTKVIFFFLF